MAPGERDVAAALRQKPYDGPPDPPAPPDDESGTGELGEVIHAHRLRVSTPCRPLTPRTPSPTSSPTPRAVYLGTVTASLARHQGWQRTPAPATPQERIPTSENNHTALVSHATTTAVSSRPPATGSAQPGSLRVCTSSTFAA